MVAVTLNIDDFAMTVKDLKVQFYEKEGLEVQYQSLIYGGKPLRDGMQWKRRADMERKLSKIMTFKKTLRFTWLDVYPAALQEICKVLAMKIDNRWVFNQEVGNTIYSKSSHKLSP